MVENNHPVATKLVSELILELGNYPDFSSLLSSARSKNWIPGFVSAGENRSLYFSQEAERIVRRLSAVLKADEPSLSRSHTDAEWHHLVRKALGPAFAWIEDNTTHEAHADVVLRMVREATKLDAPLITSEVSIGARLPSAPSIGQVLLGPVRFEPREQWLEDRVASGNMSRRTSDRIARKWSGRPLRKRKAVVPFMNETDVLEAVGNFPHVCTVTSTGLAAEAARTRSLTAARLGLTAISLLWETPSACLRGIVLKTDAEARNLVALRVTVGKLSFADRWRVELPYSPHVDQAEWDKLKDNFDDVWKVCGHVFAYYLAASDHAPKPTVTTAFLHALLWFYEGCRQELDFLAVVNFSACMDALANGDDKTGIKRLISARLGYGDHDPVFKDGPTMSQLVDDIYSDGRSRTIHGTNLNLRSDWRTTRERSEKLARLCLIACLGWGASNPLDVSPRALQQPRVT